MGRGCNVVKNWRVGSLVRGGEGKGRGTPAVGTCMYVSRMVLHTHQASASEDFPREPPPRREQHALTHSCSGCGQPQGENSHHSAIRGARSTDRALSRLHHSASL